MSSLRTVIEDRRGIITLVGLVMALVIATGGYYVFRTGADVIHKIGGQSQADAIALEGAIWQAQGMNLLVTLNILMALVLIPFLVVRLATLITLTGLIAATALSFVPVVGSAAAATLPSLTNALRTLHQTESRIAKPTMNTLKAISKSERVVAAAVPWVSLSMPINRFNGNLTALNFSFSLLPDVDQWFKDLGFTIPANKRLIGGFNPRTQFPARLGSLDSGNAGGGGRHSKQTFGQKLLDRLPTKSSGWIDFLSGSLPAQEEDYFQVCQRSAIGVGSLLLFPFTQAGLSQSVADGIVNTASKIIGSIQTLTCTPLEEFDNQIADQITNEVFSSCQKQKEEYERQPAAGQGRHSGNTQKWTAGLQQKCEKDTRKKLEGQAKDNKQDPKTRPTAEEIKTAAVWGEMLVPQGSPLTHVWGILPKLGSSFVVYTAEAEFFAPCHNYRRNDPNSSTTDNDGRACGENAMWRYAWEAMTIPERSVEEELVHSMGDFARGWANRFVAKGIQGLIGRVATKVLPSNISLPPLPGGRHRAQPTGDISELLTRHIRGLRTTEVGNSWIVRRWAGSALVGRGIVLGPDLLSRVWH